MLLKHNWIYFLIGGFTLGVLARSFFPAPDVHVGSGIFSFIAPSLFLILLAFGCAALFLRKHTSVYLLSALFLLGSALGVVRFDIAALDTGSAFLDAREGTEVVLEGVVVDEPDERETNTKLTVLIQRIEGERVEEKILITTDRYPKYRYGDAVRVTGVIDKPEAFAGDDGRVFDYAAFLGKDGIYYISFFPEIEKVGERQGNIIKQTLFDLKRKFLENVGRVVAEPQASLLGGLVVGAKQSLGENLLDIFRITGIIHIVVLSGYNVTIVAEFIMRVFSRVPKLLQWVLGIGSITLFAVLTGAGATIVRASIMAILVIVARALGRTYMITRALALAGFLMLLHNPKILVFDSSFQLSFAATVGLIYLAPQLERWFGWLPTRLQLREFATATIATQLFVLPMLLYKMGQLSIVALPVNLLVLPVIPITMLVGFLAGMAGFVADLLALPFAWLATLFLSYELAVVDVFGRIPFAAVSIDTFPLWAAAGMYALYGVFFWFLITKNSGAQAPRGNVEEARKNTVIAR